MNKFAFFFPAKIVFAERDIPDFNAYVYKGLEFRISSKNIFFSSKKDRIVVESSLAKDSLTNEEPKQIWLNVAGCLIYCSTTFNLDDWMEKNHSHIVENIDKWAEKIKHPEIYEQEATERREKIKTERAIADKEQEERLKQRAEAAEKVYQESIMAFLNGEQIPWENIERACKENRIIIPIQTLGFGRKNITSIGRTSMTTRGKYNSPKVWAAVKELYGKLNVINEVD